MREFSLSSLMSLIAAVDSPRPKQPRLFRRAGRPQQDHTPPLLCPATTEQHQQLDSLISQKLRSLQTVENVYVKDTACSRLLDTQQHPQVEDTKEDEEQCNRLEDDYAEVWDSLVERPPPLPGRAVVMPAPARPPYPAYLVSQRQRMLGEMETLKCR